jgi:NADH-quinone oxidoreductase subunit G
MASIFIDTQRHEVDDRQNLLAACLSLGFNLPYFCWHPAMGSVGACRQCAVKQFRDEQDTHGRLVMACMTPAVDGTRISIDDSEAKAFRQSVIEWLMTNHPHDCPVCDEGGECHLQDMTVMTGHAYRRYHFQKRTFRNQDLGPFIKHEMNRCIECYRCVRFYRDYAGGRDFDVFAAHNHVYFGRHEDGVLENAFSGNLIEVCPTGVFNDKPFFHHYTRKWDLQTAPSLCAHCSLGCNTISGERYGELRRIVNRYNSQVNGYFLCDRGRFGYGFVNSKERLTLPLLRERRETAPCAVSRDVALNYAAASMAKSRAKRVVGIGSPRASLEANFALRTLVGQDRFSIGVSKRDAELLALVLETLRTSPASAASIQDVEQCDAVLVLGEDLLNTAPRLALALLQSVRQQPMRGSDALHIPRWNDAAVREAIQDRKGPLYIAGYHKTWLHDFATETCQAAPDDVARLGLAIAHELDPEAPAVPALAADTHALAQRIARALKTAERPLIVSGTGSLSAAVIQAAANVARALHQAGRRVRQCYAVPEANSLGVAMMGGQSLEDAMAVDDIDTVIVLENNLYARASRTAVDAWLDRTGQLIVLDSLTHATAVRADLILPSGTCADSDGTLVNNEGRAQRFYQVFAPRETIQESWRWIRDIGERAGRADCARWRTLDEMIRAVAEALPVFHEIPYVAPPAAFRLVGQRIPRQSERFSGRTAIVADISVHEPKPPEDCDSPLAFSMEGYRGPLPSPLIPEFWAPGWNSIQALNKFQEEVGGPLRDERPGLRLIAPQNGAAPHYFADIPQRFERRTDHWLILPLYHIFGSEELSARSGPIMERMPNPYLALSADEAAVHQVAEGQEVGLMLGERLFRLPVVLHSSIPPGVAGLPVLPALAGIPLPAWGRIRMDGAA